MYKVLIVDDELIVRHAVKTMIQWENSRFEYAGSCANGQSALEHIRQYRTDIVITDIKMPDMDGIQLIRQLRAEHFDGEVLVLSNYDDFVLVREALKQSAFDYMLKLSLQSDTFMRTLNEMADKLDQKERTAAAEVGKTHSPAAPGISAASFQALLAELCALPPSEPLPAALTSRQAPWGKAEQAFAFLAVLHPSVQEQDELARFETALVNLLGELFPGSRRQSCVRLQDGEFLLAAGYEDERDAGLAANLARRIVSLTKMYYNIPVGVVYAPGSPDVPRLAVHIRECLRVKNRLFDGLPGAEDFILPLAEPETESAGQAAAVHPADYSLFNLQQAGVPAAIRPEVQKVLLYLKEHYAERVLLPNVAAHVNLSEAYLCQLFKAETGKSILNCLNDFRMSKAHELLASGRFLVKEAAAEVGIHDPFYFNRLFRRKYGVSPKQIKSHTS